MTNRKIVLLSGGTGTPKLLKQAIKGEIPELVTVIANTGDDWNFYGLHVSPDIDSVLFTLSNIINMDKWWGIRGDSFNMVKFLRDKLKEDIWFNLGDFDTALCLYRSFLLKQGNTLTEAIDVIRKRLDIKTKVLPMANQPIQTKIRTPENIMHLQEFWVKYKGEPEVENVFFDGDLRKTTPEVVKAILEAKLIIIGPSNPVSSIGPILSIIPLRKALEETKAKKISISPVIGDKPISGPTKKFLRAWNRDTTPFSIAEIYKDFIDIYIMDTTDKKYLPELKKLGIEGWTENILFDEENNVKRIIERIKESV
ncbi:MAG: 2-phospho-L-lactate transferase [Candidatus Hodarchaeales archaeon]